MMRWFYLVPLRFRSLFRKDRLEQELSDELRFHLEELMEEKRAKGISGEEARCAALRELGGVDQIKEECRDMRRVNQIESFGQDLRYGLRQLRRSPGFTVVTVLTLALGIGANTAIFTLVNALLLKSLPVHEPNRLVLLGHGVDRGVVGEAQRGSWELFSYSFYQYLRDGNQVFQGVSAIQSFEVGLSIKVGKIATSAPGKLVSGNYFSVLGVHPHLGRMLTPEDDKPEAAPTAVISYRFWDKLFSQDASVPGKIVSMNGVTFTIVGVTPPQFFGETLQTDPPDIWLPLAAQPQVSQQGSLLTPNGPYWLDIMGRLKPGASLQQAQANVSGLLRGFLDEEVRSQVSSERWNAIKDCFIVLTPGGKGLSELRESFTTPLYILLAAVGLILLIACASVANLLMARANERQREVSVRLALGASRARLIRQLLTESVLLAMCGGAAGLLFARWGTMALVKRVANGADHFPLSVSPDLRVLGFTLGVCFLTGILFGLAPALRAGRSQPASALKEGSRTTQGGGGGWAGSRSLVVFQVAVSLFLLIGSGLLVRALRALANQDWGFAREKVLIVRMDPERAGYKPAQLPVFYRELLDRVNALPRVRCASLALYSWLSDMQMLKRVTVPGYTPQPDERTTVQVNLAGPRYFETEGMTLLLGRDFDTRDTEGSLHVAVVNEALVRRFYFGQNPIGKTLHFQTMFEGGDIEVVGVVKNAKYNSPIDDATQMVFLPVLQASGELAQLGAYVGNLEVRAKGDPTSVVEEVRAAIADLDNNLPIDSVTTLNDLVDRSLNQETLIAGLSSLFAVLAMLLACVGLYGVMSYAVARRTNEIGIRMALGALRSDVLGLVVGHGFRLTLTGVVLGTAGALPLAHFLASLPIGVKPVDPLTFFAVSLGLTVVALIASYIPARRVTKVDPMVALRHE
ncbi:MAG TPA: ABC transporter permease [Terriglobales bacterium]|nr:ABC transporter permease [Terriglobales bacterium]